MTAVTVKLYSTDVKGGSMYVACQEFSSVRGMKREMVEQSISFRWCSQRGLPQPCLSISPCLSEQSGCVGEGMDL